MSSVYIRLSLNYGAVWSPRALGIVAFLEIYQLSFSFNRFILTLGDENIFFSPYSGTMMGALRQVPMSVA
jgi:hypothetical protein